MRVAVVHDWLIRSGGAEQVLRQMLEMFDTPPDLFTLIWDRRRQPWAHSYRVQTSFLQHFPGVTRYYTALLPLMPLAVERLDLTGYDLVLSSSHAVAKGVITRAESLHVSYVHTPMRYVWDLWPEHLGTSLPKAVMATSLRKWDLLSSFRVDRFIANSRTVRERIRKHYRREADVVFPPLNPSYLDSEVRREKDSYYLVVSRLVRYKRVDLALEAAKRLGVPIRVVGKGPELQTLMRHYPPGEMVRYETRLSDAQLREMYRNASALLFAGEEDFGLVPVEAQASGCPVIAYGRGGALDTVVPGVTGVLFERQDVDALTSAMKEARSVSWDPDAIRRHATNFLPERFRAGIRAVVDAAWQERYQSAFPGWKRS